MKRFIAATISALTVVLVLSSASPALAWNPFKAACDSTANPGDSAVCSGQNTSTNPITGSSGVVINATNVLALITGVAAVVMIIVGGLKYITSSGDPAGVNSAKNTILYAVVGLVVVVAARSIVVFIVSRLN